MPSNSGFCEDCAWWVFTYPDGDNKFGTCENVNVYDKIRVAQDEDSIDEPTVFTEALFGCKYFEKGEGVAEIKIL